MITIIFGEPGAGKTALETHFITEAMKPKVSDEDIRQSNKMISKLREGGFTNLTETPAHTNLCFSDYAVSYRSAFVSPRTCWKINGYRVGLPNKSYRTDFIPPYARIFLDESQKYYNSRLSSNFADFVSRWFEIHRHNHFSVMLACQRCTLIDLNIRDIAGQFIEVVKMDNKINRDGVLIRSTWHCNEFTNTKSLNNYLSTGDKKYVEKKTKYIHEGNIFNCYDSYGQWPQFYKDRYDEDFDRKPHIQARMTVESIQQWVSENDYEEPEGYRKNAKRSYINEKNKTS